MILESEVDKWFEYNHQSKYMLMVFTKNNVKLDQSKNFNKSIRNINSLIPATTHVDGSARIQTINGLMEKFLIF